MPTTPAQPIRLYNSPMSGHCHRVRLLLSLLDLPHEVIDLDMRGGEHKKAAFLAKNPLGQVPVIEDGDVTLYDSNAILIYLALRYDDGTWLPRDPLAAATVQRWLGLAAGPIYYGPNLARLAVLLKAPVDHDAAKAVAGRLLGAMERELDGRDFVLDSGPSLAEVAAYAYVARAPEGGITLDPYPNVRAWLARIEALPRFVPMMAAAAH